MKINKKIPEDFFEAYEDFENDEAIQKDYPDLYRDKLKAQIAKINHEIEKIQFKLQELKNKYMTLDELKLALNLRQAAFEGGFGQRFLRIADEMIRIVNGDKKKKKLLIKFLMNELKEHVEAIYDYNDFLQELGIGEEEANDDI